MSATKEGLLLLAQQGFIVNNHPNSTTTETTPFQLLKLPFTIRIAKLTDLEKLLLLEKECWKHLSSPPEELIKRLTNAPYDQYVAELPGAVGIIGVMYTQRIQSMDILKKEGVCFENQTNYHDPTGVIVQLLGVAVLSEYASLNISLILRDFVLQVTRATSEIHSVIAMTRCSNSYPSEEMYLRHFRQDPTVLFHVNGGAEIIEIVKHYRSRDVSNYGHSILVRYTLKEDFHDFDFNEEEEDQAEKDVTVTRSMNQESQRERYFSKERQYSSDRLYSLEGESRTVRATSRARSDEKEMSEQLKKLLRFQATNNLPNNTTTGKIICSEETFIEIMNQIRKNSSSPFEGNELFFNRPFMDLGLDSLQMIELRNFLLYHFQLPDMKFPPTILFDYSTPLLLLQYINNGCNPLSSSFPSSQKLNRRRSESGVALLAGVNNNSTNDIASLPSKKDESILICGLSCRLPGGANDPELFYQLLIEGKTAFTEIPKTWQEENHDLNEGKSLSSSPRYASFLDESVANTFDPNFFGISVNEAQLMDPHQKILLEVAHEALTDAGLLMNSQFSTTRIGIFVGACNNEWILQATTQNTKDVLQNPYLGCCVAQSSIANRISYCLGLYGPSMVIDTACSSSLNALHVAIQSLEKGDCDFAVIASADLLLSPLSLKLRDVAGMLSTNDRIRAFGEGADGYIRGEGAVAIVLGRSAILAISSLTPIYAKILGSVINHDGKSASFTAPSGIAQRNLLQDALEKCHLGASEVDYIECHGTGTKLGDPIEWTAIKEVFLQQEPLTSMSDPHPLVLSAVKTNIGHLEGAAGLVGLLKAVLSVYHGNVPRSPEGIEISKFIDQSKPPHAREVFILPTENIQLRTNAIAGISSFGSGGSNGHVLIQGYQSKRYQQRKQSKAPPKVAFIYSGQGGLSKEIATAFYKVNESFRSLIKQIDLKYSIAPKLSTLLGDEDELLLEMNKFDWLKSPVHSNFVLFVIEYTLTRLWNSAGVYPAVVLGHSFGEIVAAVASNIFTLDEALDLTYYRALALSKHLQENAVMTAIRASAKEVSKAIQACGYANSTVVAIAAVNGPKSVVLSGTQDAVTNVLRELNVTSFRNLHLNIAYHSPLILDAANDFKRSFTFSRGGDTSGANTPFISCYTGETISSDRLRSVDYWHSQMLSTVRFEDCVKHAFFQQNCQIFVEIGPDSSFGSLASACIPTQEFTPDQVNFISSLNQKSRYQLLSDITINILRVQKLIDGKLLGGRFSKSYKPIVIPWRSAYLPFHLNNEETEMVPSSPSRRSGPQRTVYAAIEEALISLIGESRIKEINKFTPFTSMGIDSLGSIVMRNYLSREFHFLNNELPQGIIFQYQNIAALSENIQELLENREGTPFEEGTITNDSKDTVANDHFATTSIQQSMIFHHLSDPAQASFIETFVWEVYPNEDETIEVGSLVDVMYRTLLACVNYFPGLRTIFYPFTVPIATQTILSMDEFLKMYPTREASEKWMQLLDWNDRQDLNSKNQYEEEISKSINGYRQSFQDLSECPLFHMTIVIPPSHLLLSTARILFTIHHVITDGISTSLLLRKFEEYSVVNSNELIYDSNLPSSPSYEMVVLREKQVKEDPRMKTYWNKLLKENMKVIKQNTNSASSSNDNWVIDLSDEEVIREYLSINEHYNTLTNIARSMGVTVSCLFHTLFGLYCTEFYETESVCYGTTIYGRSGSEGMDSIFGPTLNTVPFFHRIPSSTGTPTNSSRDSTTSNYFHQYLRFVQQQLSEALEFGMYPLAEIMKVSTELLAQQRNSTQKDTNDPKNNNTNPHGNRLFNLIFDYQQNRWDFHLNVSPNQVLNVKFLKLLDRIGCPLSIRVLVNEKQSNITLIATSESSHYQRESLQNMLHGFQEMILSMFSLYKKETISQPSSSSAQYPDFTVTQLKKEFNSSFQVKQQKFSTIFPTVKGKTWSLPYVDFSVQCNKKILSTESMITTIFTTYCYALAKYCTGADFVGVLYAHRGRQAPSLGQNLQTIITVPFDLRTNETLQELIDRVDELITRNISDHHGNQNHHYDSPLFLSFEEDDELINHFNQYPVVLQIQQLYEDGANLRIYWNLEEIPLEVRNLTIQCLQSAFSKWCNNKNEIYRRSIQLLKQDVRNIKTYLPDQPFPDVYLHDPILASEDDELSTFSVVCYSENQERRLVLSFDELQETSQRLSKRLVHQILHYEHGRGVTFEITKPSFLKINSDIEPSCNGVIAVVMEKGWEQVVACLAILRLGHAYLPMDAKSWSEHRIRQVLEISNAVAVVTQTNYITSSSGEWMHQALSIPVIAIDEQFLFPEQENFDSGSDLQNPRFQTFSTDQLAYLIYTSGSTGLPKGVCCHHKGAMNTINDLNDYFTVTAADRVLGLSSLSFDLSVYDIFGMLACGGCLVLPSPNKVSPPDPAEWYNIVKDEGITIWNTVPAFMELIVTHVEIIGARLPESLRLIYMSGDWIPINLPGRIRAVSDCKDIRIISMGGATEAAIWSNIFEIGKEGLGIPEGWTSVPYGQPMRNQEMYILNDKLDPCELWVTGGIYIGGVGVAHGYYKNEERTRYQFITHPRTGEKLFRTGDLGRVRPGGLLEILGREDNQVKVNGFRIELGEIEKTLLQHDKVQNTVVSVQNNSLCAYIVLRDSSNDSESDLTSVSSDYHDIYDDLEAICRQNLTEYMIPQHFMVIEKVPLSSNGKIARDLLPKVNAVGKSNAIIHESYSWNEKESILLNVWSTILGVEEQDITPSTNFFSIGGDSLRSIQVVAQCKSLGLLVGIANIFKFPTISSLAQNCTLLKELGPEVLGKVAGSEENKPIFTIHSRDETPYEEYPLIGINSAHYVGLHTSSFAAEGMTPQIYFEWEFSEKTLLGSTTKGNDNGKQLDIKLLESAIDLFIERHVTFRSVVTTHGTMKPLEYLPHYSIPHVHYWDGQSTTAKEALLLYRKEMMTQYTTVHQWPLFEVRVTQISENTSIIHIAVSLFLMDAMSDLILRQELSALYRSLHLGEKEFKTLPEKAKISFKDYCIALTEQLPQSLEFIRAKKYWLERLPSLKTGPELPLLISASARGESSSQSGEQQTVTKRLGNFVNRHLWLTAAEYSRAKKNCASHSVTMPSVLLTAYSIALSRYATSNEFLLNILLCLRHQVHEDVNKLVGNCSSTILCNIDLTDASGDAPLSFLTAIRRIAKELSSNLEYSAMSGVEVMQELNRRRGNTFQAVAPFIFTTPIGVEQGNRQVASRDWMFQELFFSERVPHTACVNAVKADPNGTACVSMDFVDGLFPTEVIDGVFNVYITFIKLLCSSNSSDWNHPIRQYFSSPHAATCYCERPLPVFDAYLHDSLVKGIKGEEDRLAVVAVHEGKKVSLTYKLLEQMSKELAITLAKNIVHSSVEISDEVPVGGPSCNGVIAVVMEKGWEQVVACLAILRLGHAYLPMDAKSWSEHRIRQVLEISNAVAVVTQSAYIEDNSTGEWLKHNITIPVIAIDENLIHQRHAFDEKEVALLETTRFLPSSSDQLAYLIYTSGSTGLPKGVCCHHKGAMNTINDLNDYFTVTAADKVLGLSSLSFDLSVYDIFGMLACGGCLVLPSPNKVSPPDPAEWYNIVKDEGITIWNTVPAFMELLVSHLEIVGSRLPETLRLIYMSGDWIPINLPGRIRALTDRNDLRIISMGGATEAAIWSNIFEIGKEGLGIPEGWTSVPYGQPMRNQKMYILNEKLEHCEMWVTGGIYIGGVGVAHGYYKNEERTRYQFITHPRTGEKLFRTGDLGRVRPGGLLEILGREDNQVKVNGFRIELGEIEKTLLQHDKVQNTVVSVQNNSLCAYVIIKEQHEQDRRDQQLQSLFRRLRDLCKQRLTEYMIPQHFMIIQELPLNANGKIARDRLPKLAPANTNTGTSNGVTGEEDAPVTIIPPKNPLQQQIRSIFATILKITDETTICCESHTFFTLGGNSLLSIQLLFAIRKQLQKVMTVQDLFQYSTVQKIYEFLYPSNPAATEGEEEGNIGEEKEQERKQQRLFHYTLSTGQKGYSPVFLFNPAGASGLCYLKFASIIGDRYPTYAIDDGCIQNGLPFTFQSIYEVAETALPLVIDILNKHYSQQQQQQQPSSGPIMKLILAGWSYGGVVAIEIAKLIHSQGLDQQLIVQCITLFDSPVTAPIFPLGEGSQQDDFPAELLIVDTHKENDTTDPSSSEGEIQNLTRLHFNQCTSLLEAYYTTASSSSTAAATVLSCPIHDIRAEKSNYFIPYESIEQLTTKKDSIQRTMILNGNHWNIVTGAFIQQTSQETLQFWEKYLK